MSNSTHKVEVLRIEEVQKHENADLLEIIPIFDGYTAVVQNGSFRVGDIAAYVPPDSLVDTSRPEFSFLATDVPKQMVRIKAKKLRGVWSMGLLLHAPPGANIGDDLASALGVEHYEPPMTNSHPSRPGYSLQSAGCTSAPKDVHCPVYDLENWRRYGSKVFNEGEAVFITEKIHGANARYVWSNGELHCGSRNQWKREFSKLPSYEELLSQIGDETKALEVFEKLSSKDSQDVWWRAIRQYPATIEWLKTNPNTILYGELYGRVQDLTYGTVPGEVRLAFFDAFTLQGEWLPALDLLSLPIPQVPPISIRSYHHEDIAALASGNSRVPGAEQQIREGIVIRPLEERSIFGIGRAVLKVINPEYLAR